MQRKRLNKITVTFAAAFLATALLAGQPGKGVDPRRGAFCIPPWPCPTGSWMAQITIPPGSPLGNPEDVVVPELGTFGRGGGVIFTPHTPIFPLPTGPSLSSIGHANWKWAKGGRIVTTNWRFLSDPATGELLGILKIFVELEFSGPDVLEGNWFLEIIEPSTGSLLHSFGPGTLVMNRLPVEPFDFGNDD